MTSALVYRLRERDAEVASPEIIVTSHGERYWLLRIDQKGGGVGSGDWEIEIGWVPHKLVFAGRGSRPFQLAYGGQPGEARGLGNRCIDPRLQD